MEGLLIDLPWLTGQEYNLTVYSDLHLDASACATDTMLRHMRARAALPNAIFALIGDIGNWILPGLDKRSTPTVPKEELRGEPEYVNKAVEMQVELLNGFPWIFMGIGNHEYTLINNTAYNPIRDVIKALNDNSKYQIRYAGYSGFSRLRIGTKASYNILYHHGAWVAPVSVIPPGAIRYADGQEGYELFVFGHNHRIAGTMKTKRFMNDKGRICHRDVIIASTGAFQRSGEQGEHPSWEERRGFPPVTLAAPLVHLRMRRTHDEYLIKASLEMEA